MTFDDNFIEPVAGSLIDPVLKIRLGTSAPRESYDFTEAVVTIWYDPEIAAQNLTQPLPADLQAVYRRTPGHEHKADDPVIFASDRSVRLGWLNVDLELRGTGLHVRVRADLKLLRYRAEDIANAAVPMVSEKPVDFILYVIRSITRFSEFRNVGLRRQFPKLKTIDVFVPSDVARECFSVPGQQPTVTKSNWVCIASAQT